MRVLISSSIPWYISHVHTKVIAIDVTSDTPPVIPGSHNISGNDNWTAEYSTRGHLKELDRLRFSGV